MGPANPTMAPATLTLVRHGETTGESSIRFNGVTDVPLSALGEAQMAAASRVLADRTFDAAFTSPLIRAQRSMAIVWGERSAPKPLIVHDFREVDFGHWEGWTREEIAERDPEGATLWDASKGDFTFPGGDSRYGFRERVAKTAALHLENGEGHILAVLHKGVLKVICAALTGGDEAELGAFDVELGAIIHLVRDGGIWRRVGPAHTDHLGDLRQPGT